MKDILGNEVNMPVMRNIIGAHVNHKGEIVDQTVPQTVAPAPVPVEAAHEVAATQNSFGGSAPQVKVTVELPAAPPETPKE